MDWSRVTANAAFGNRAAHCSVVFNGKMWVLGGAVEYTAPQNDVWSSTDGVTWTKVTDAAQWSKRSAHNAVVFDNKMWIMAGSGSSYSLRNDVWYSSDGKNWTCATSNAPWRPRFCAHAVVYNNKIWIMGGNELKGQYYFNDVWYSTDGAKWTPASPPTAGWSPRYGLLTAAYNNKLWVVGGGGDGEKGDVWYYEEPVNVDNGTTTTPATPGLTIHPPHSRPAGGPVTMRYTLNKTGNVNVGIYTCTGRKVRTLWDGIRTAGTHTLEWNGRDDGTKHAGAGVFFVRCKTVEGEVTRTIVTGK